MAEKTDRSFDEYVTAMRGEVPFLDFAPVVSISAKTGQRVSRVLELAVDVWGERRKRIPTPELNRVIRAASLRQAPPAGKLGPPKIFYATQVAVAPPTFVFFARHADQVHFSYKRFLENQLRAEFGFDGTPVRLFFRERASGRSATRMARGGGVPAGRGRGTRSVVRGGVALELGIAGAAQGNERLEEVVGRSPQPTALRQATGARGKRARWSPVGVWYSVGVGAWRSLVAHLNGVQEAERSKSLRPDHLSNVKRPRRRLRGPLDSGSAFIAHRHSPNRCKCVVRWTRLVLKYYPPTRTRGGSQSVPPRSRS